MKKEIVKSKNKDKWRWDVFVLLLQIILTKYVMVAHQIVLPKRDSGAFLYMGQQILDGKIPYLDIWDHKGPLLFYLNAIGLKLGHGKFTGVINLQTVLTVAASFIIYYVVDKVYGRFCGIIASLLIILLLIKTSVTGNQVGQWALIFQAATILLYYLLEKSNKKVFIKAIGIGLLGGAVFLLRQNRIALWLGLGIVFVVEGLLKKTSWRHILKSILGITLGVLITLGFTIVYFYSHNALDAFWDATFIYNFSYSSATFSSRLNSVFVGFSIVEFAAFAAGAATVVFVFFNVKREQSIGWKLSFLASIVFILEVIMTSISGRSTTHYYTNWLVAVALLVAFMIHFLLQLKADDKYLKYMRISISVIFIFTCSTFVNKYCRKVIDYKAHEGKWYREHITEYIKSVSTTKDYVLHWGTVGSLNFLTDRESPSKYFYQYALRTPGYTSNKKVNDFLNDLKSKTPKVIVDHTDDKLMPPLDRKLRKQWMESNKDKYTFPSNIEDFFLFVEKHYIFTGHIGKIRFYILKSYK